MKIDTPRVVIIGGGFGGLNAAIELGKKNHPVTIIDRQNYHLFQPLLYQVATGFLTPGEIAFPLRSALAEYKSVKIILDEVKEICHQEQEVVGTFGRYPYDTLILSTGVSSSYFGHDDWQQYATGLKSIDDSLRLRSEILSALEAAERSCDEGERQRLLTFVIVGGGPTGVELAGALSELVHSTVRQEFRSFDPTQCKVVLYERGDRILSSFHPKISKYAETTLAKLGVEICLNTTVTDLGNNHIGSVQQGINKRLEASTLIWAAGVKASPLIAAFQKSAGVKSDQSGRIMVEADLRVPGYSNIFVIGDAASCPGTNGRPLPGLAPVAMQQGKYVANVIRNLSGKKKLKPFRYYDKGNMAVIGKGRAVAETGMLRLTGFLAWIGWAFIHIFFLVEFENKIIVFLRWAWNFFTNRRGSRLITKL